MATGSLISSCLYPMSKVAEFDLQQASKSGLSTNKQPVTSTRRSTVQLKPSRREQLLAQPTKKAATISQPSTTAIHLDRSDWVPDFNDPDTERPDEVNKKRLSKVQLEHLNKLYHLQYRRSLDSWYKDGGFFTKAIGNCEFDLKQLREADSKIEREHAGDDVRSLLLNNIQQEVEVAKQHCHPNTIDFIFEIKQTRTCLKKAKDSFNDLKPTMELTERFCYAVELLLGDWSEITKYHRKRTLPTMLHSDLVEHKKLLLGRHQYRIILESEFPHKVRIEPADDTFTTLTKRDTLVTVCSNEDSRVQVDKLFHRYFKDSTATLQLVKEGTIKLQELLRLMRDAVNQFEQRADLVDPFVSISNQLLVRHREHFPLQYSAKRSNSHQRYQKVLQDSASGSQRQQRLQQ